MTNTFCLYAETTSAKSALICEKKNWVKSEAYHDAFSMQMILMLFKTHNENMPMQYTEIFKVVKNENF